MIFGAHFVEVRVVDAHSPLAIGLADQDRVSQPFSIPKFPNETCLKQFIYLLLDGGLFFLLKLVFTLGNWSRFGVNG